MLIAGYNYAKYDLTGPTGTTRLSNSEILFQQYRAAQKFALSKGGTSLGPSGLNEVIRSSIQNQETQLILDMAFTKATQKARETEFLAGTEEFFALLGTDNCKGVAFMLADHPVAFGRKTISSIVALSSSYMRIKLGPGPVIETSLARPMGPSGTRDQFSSNYPGLEFSF